MMAIYILPIPFVIVFLCQIFHLYNMHGLQNLLFDRNAKLF